MILTIERAGELLPGSIADRRPLLVDQIDVGFQHDRLAGEGRARVHHVAEALEVVQRLDVAVKRRGLDDAPEIIRTLDNGIALGHGRPGVTRVDRLGVVGTARQELQEALGSTSAINRRNRGRAGRDRVTTDRRGDLDTAFRIAISAISDRAEKRTGLVRRGGVGACDYVVLNRRAIPHDDLGVRVAGRMAHQRTR